MDVIGSIRMPKVVHYGEGSIEKLRLEVNQLGKRALIVSDNPMNELGYINKLQTLLTECNVDSSVYLGIDSETKDTHVEEAFTTFQKDECDFIIALGGGSCIDAAKAAAVRVNNQEDFMDYVNGATIQHEPVPVVAIPTTAGTGSEVTDAFVVTNTSLDIKMMIKQPVITPHVAIVDPSLTVSVPRSLTVATGIDALSHGVEAFLSRRAHVFTDDIALISIKSIMKNIRDVYTNGDNLKARANMALASMQAGIAFSNSSVALVHGMSRPIGALFNIPHGISNAMLLAPVLEFSLPDCQEQLAQIGRHIDERLGDKSDEVAAKEFISLIKQLCADLEIPSLEEWGVDREKFIASLDKMATDALASGSPSNNPRTPLKEEIIKLYEICFTYQYTTS
ncbi:MAG TPA: iron-containing alcohol dehydrogenase [Pseudogracilibacillus sp.]|nr:iron-containing alcohol dehydrogenase [Pseudogracilibacillus sp.]